jgi:hypothetical protein
VANTLSRAQNNQVRFCGFEFRKAATPSMRNSQVSSSTSGGLLSTFASAAFSEGETTPSTIRQELTVIRDRKRVRSRFDIGSCRFDSLALIPCDDDKPNNDDCSPKNKRTRERSRPRAIDTSRTSLTSSATNSACQQGLNVSSSINTIEKHITYHDNPTKTQEKPTTSKGAQRVSVVFETDQDEDIDVQSIDHGNYISEIHTKDSFHVTSPDSRRDLRHAKKMEEATAEIVVTPIKTRRENISEHETKRCPNHKNTNLGSSKSIDIVTPSPTRQRAKRQKMTTTTTTTKSAITASDVPASILMSKKHRKLKRVSKLRSTCMKKPVVALTQAITAGNKTIPARHTVCASEDKKRKTRHVASKSNISPTKSFPTDNVSKGLDSKNAMSKINKVRSANSIISLERKKEDSTTRKPKTYNKISETSSTNTTPKMKHCKIQNPKDTTTISVDTPKQQNTRATKKLAILDFIEEIISKLNDLKDDVKNICNDEDFLVDISELRERYIPLSHRDVFLNASSYKDIMPQFVDRKFQTWIGMKPVPSRPSPSLHTWKSNSNTMFSHFFNSPNGDGDESCCESVIDLGTISDPHALVKYAFAKKVSPNDSQNDDPSNCVYDDKSHDHEGNSHICEQLLLEMQCEKRDGGKSRIHNSTSDILATFASVGPTSKEEHISNDHIEKNQVSTATLNKSAAKTIPVMEQTSNKELSFPFNQTIHDRFRELFELDHDELIQNELRARYLSCVVTNTTTPTTLESIAKNDNDLEISNQYDNVSSWDDLFLSIPTLSY